MTTKQDIIELAKKLDKEPPPQLAKCWNCRGRGTVTTSNFLPWLADEEIRCAICYGTGQKMEA